MTQRPSTHQFAAHQFSSLDSTEFCTSEYSRLKFGSDRIARKFGYEMADAFFAANFEMLTQERCVVIPSAYNVVEIAATILARHFMDRLNLLMVHSGHDIVEWTTMHRTVSYLNDYADVSAEERVELLSRDQLFIKRDFIAGKTLLFVDDIHITGTHEKMICRYLDDIGFSGPVHFICYAAYAGDRPGIEGDLNRSGIRSLADYLPIMQREPMHLMVRTLRLWMQAEPAVLREALAKVDPDYVDRLYHAILARGYYKVPEMAQGYRIIRDYRHALGQTVPIRVA